MDKQSIPPATVVILIAGPLLGALFLVVPGPEGLSGGSWRLIGLLSWMVLWWVFEVVPLPVTALLPIPFMPLFQIMELPRTTAQFGDPLIFLFFGGFVLGVAMQRWNLHRRLALNIVAAVGSGTGPMIGGFMVATAFLSMWISNTATSVIMFAVGISLIDYLADRVEHEHAASFGRALMLGIAYSASIGGVGTLIGTPPNGILASVMSNSYGVEVSFANWIVVGLPVVAVMLPAAWLWLTRVAFPLEGFDTRGLRDTIRDELESLGAMKSGEKIVAWVFAGTAVCWIGRSFLQQYVSKAISDPVIAVFAACLLFALPSSIERNEFAVDWDISEDIPWGVLLLFGGGLAVAEAFQTTGLADTIGNGVSGLEFGSPWILAGAISLIIVFLTELTSNTATSATFIPIMAAAATGLAVDPMLLAVPVALSASMAFMMPIATPPNAIVFAYDDLRIRDMLKAGLALNFLTIFVVTLTVYLLVPSVFGMMG